MLDLPVERPKVLETTAFGAAALAAIGAGVFPSLETIKGVWKLDTEFEPNMDEEARRSVLTGWKTSVQKVLTD